ncbi:MAG TPA: tRNA glutamyl-Q(34) synthetase GluQRS [Luteimonas sp.]|nr:tRNA glutamyl-Q(34) synthetase GluQRS [Luteimonas sp.]
MDQGTSCPRGRFAPSPTGPLHLGSLLAAFGSWLMARSAGGEWWLRIEDLDPPREVPGATRHQLDTLKAFGFVPDGPVARQSRRSALYAAALERLLDEGKAFACHCSRADVAAAGGVHRACAPGAHRRDPSIRLRVAHGRVVAFDDALHGRVEQDVSTTIGDVVLRRADGWFAYQLAVVVDDAQQGMTQVVRGSDLLASTPRQMLLQAALGLPTPCYAHLPLLLDADGRKLSKSLASMAVDASSPRTALRLAWRALGQDGHALADARGAPLAQALEAFDPSRIPRGALPVAALHNGVDRDAH